MSEEHTLITPEPAPSSAETRPFPRAALATRRATSWYSVGWLIENFGHLVASALAKSDIDGRDWMTPDEPRALCAQVARAAGFAHVEAATLSDAVDGEVWLDYVADTGDDADVSREIARLVARPYRLPLPEPDPSLDAGATIDAPRGAVLFLGGDSAYPIATGAQLKLRLVDPWNEVLAAADDGKTRALLATPGNHDWNDGLDGFNRLFRRKRAPTTATKPASQATLDLHGYIATQDASYFALPLAPGLALLAPDRQLDKLDFRQRAYFDTFRKSVTAASGAANAWVIAQGDPCFSFGAPNRDGEETRTALGLTDAPALLLAGDSHHYVRLDEPRPNGVTVTHVTAGGGGAALHPTLDSQGDTPKTARLWPSPDECGVVASAVPLRLWSGAAGWLIHFGLAAVYTLFFGLAALWAAHSSWQTVPFLILATSLFGLAIDGSGRLFKGRPREPEWRGATALASFALAFVPFGATLALEALVPGVGAGWKLLAAIGIGVLTGPLFIGGLFLWAVRAGVDQTMAYAALGHPGFKHFLRMRVHRDGRAIDVWCIGLRNPLEPGEPPVLVDSFRWRAPDRSDG